MSKIGSRLPMILVVVMVLLLLAPAVRTIATSSGSNSAAIAEDTEYYLKWDDYVAGHGISAWNWNDAADAIEKVAIHAADLYEAGDKDPAYEYAKATYWGYYETTGFERNTMTYISGSRVSACELQFTTFRKAVKKDLGIDAVHEEGEKLSQMLHEDALILSPEGSSLNVASGASSGGAAATFVGSLLIIVREGLEAILIVGAIIAYLIKTTDKSEDERKRQLRPVYAGAVLGIILSFVSAWALNRLKLANSASQEVIEGVTALIAVVVLFWVSNWMVSKSESEAWDAYIKSKVGEASDKGSSVALAFTAFLAVYREGAEVILFYQPLLSGDNMKMVWLGFAIGCVCLVFVYLAIRLLSVRLPLKPFFLATSILMAIMSIAFLGSGIKELIEGDVIMMTSPAWVAWIPSNSLLEILGIYPCVQTVVPQIILTVITVITFIYWLNRNKNLRNEMAQEAN